MATLAAPNVDGMVGQTELVALSNGGAVISPADDEETFEETIEGTLEETLEGTVEEQTVVVEVHQASSTEIMMAKATEALALALARTAPVEVSSSMAFDNIDMDNLCRVRSEDSAYSTVYTKKSTRAIQKWLENYHREKSADNISRGSLEASEEDDDETFQTWNTLGSDDDETQQEEASVMPYFDMKATVHGYEEVDADERSDDTREPPAEHVVLNADDNSIIDVPKKHSGWRRSSNPHMKHIKKEETKLTIRHQKEHVEVVVNSALKTNEVQKKKKFKGGKRVVRFWSPKLSKKFGRIIQKGKRSSAADPPSDASASTTKSTEMKPVCEKDVDVADCDETSTLNDSTVVSSKESSSVVDSLPSDEQSVSTRSGASTPSIMSGTTENTRESAEKQVDELSVASIAKEASEEQVDEAAVSSVTEEAATLELINELVRDASDDNGFEVEMTMSDDLSVSELSIRDESLESMRSGSLSRTPSAMSTRSIVSKTSTVLSRKSTASKMSRSQRMPSQKPVESETIALPAAKPDDVSVTDRTHDTWGSYVDDDESQAAPLIVPFNINMKRSRSKSRSFQLKRVISGMSMRSPRSRSGLGLEPIRKIEEEREEDVNEEIDEKPTIDTTKINDDDNQIPHTNDNDQATHQVDIAVACVDNLPLTDEDEEALSVDEISIEMDVDGVSVDEVSVEIDVDDSSDDESTVCESAIVVSTLPEEEDASLAEMPGFEVLELPQEVNGLFEV